MKKLFLISAGLLIACFAQAQPVSDNATIPIGVTLNSILRLTVVSGGNIEFVVSTMEDYTNGINKLGTNTRYQTKFNVASSVDYSVTMYSEEDDLYPTDIAAPVAADKIPLNNVGFDLWKGAGLVADGAGYNYYHSGGAVAALTGVSAPTALILGPAGGATANTYTIRWRLGTMDGGGMATTTLLAQSLPSGRYTANVVLVLASQ